MFKRTVAITILLLLFFTNVITVRGLEIEVTGNDNSSSNEVSVQHEQTTNSQQTNISDTNNDVDTSFSTLEMTWYGMRDKRIKEQVGMLLPKSFFEVVKGKTINYYSDAEESKVFIEKCTEAVLTKEKMLLEQKRKTKEITEEMQKFAKEVASKIETLSSQELVKVLRETKRLQAECVVYGTAEGFADVLGGITNKLIAVVEKRKNLKHTMHVYTSVLAMPIEKTYTENAQNEIRSAKETPKALAKKYFWLHQGYVGRGITEEEVKKIQKTKATKTETQ